MPAKNARPPGAGTDRYTGFVLGPKGSAESTGQIWLAGFVFRPTQERRGLDVTVTALAVECPYSPAEYEALFRQLESLVTFTAVATAAGNMELTSCPTDARRSGNLHLER